ncbi:MAG: 1-acyl-sn-glycerol-3-phosphate acyltransferase [Calditrichaeota bacterium]|nr:1-acyl-sn-glycerol-3-phosphate acyltransferase [Calditrichota bacterium]MCB9368229.1 1-acyl-sn-glycerol-3-phosphate acyltransferase [Calditrichota bacterium]
MRAFYATVAWTARTLFRILYGVRVTGLENLPKSGSVLICSNHRSNLDPPILGSHLDREVSYFAKAELFTSPIFGPFLRKLNAFPVKRGQMDKAAMTTCLKVLKSDGALVFFPEGTRAPANGYLYPKFGVGWVLYKTRADVVPLYVHGTATGRKFTLKRPQMEVVVGKPVSAESIIQDASDTRDGYQQVADRILNLIRDLSLNTTIAKITEPGQISDRSIIEDERLR